MKSIHFFCLLFVLCLKSIGGNTAFANKKPNLLDVYINPRFEYDVNNPSNGRVVGTTNLPDNTKMFLGIRGVKNGWFDHVEIHIKNGTFYSDFLVGSLIKMNKEIAVRNNLRIEPLSAGEYRLNFIMTAPPYQKDKSVRDIIGNNGEFLVGKLITKPFSEKYIGKDICSTYWKDDLKRSYKKERMKCIESSKESENMRNVEYATSIYLDGNESEEENNRVASEEMNKHYIILSEKINTIEMCNNAVKPEYYSSYTERQTQELSCGNSSLKFYKEEIETIQYCKMQNEIPSGLCYMNHKFNKLLDGCYFNSFGDKKTKQTKEYTERCLKNLGVKNKQ